MMLFTLYNRYAHPDFRKYIKIGTQCVHVGSQNHQVTEVSTGGTVLQAFDICGKSKKCEIFQGARGNIF